VYCGHGPATADFSYIIVFKLQAAIDVEKSWKLENYKMVELLHDKKFGDHDKKIR